MLAGAQMIQFHPQALADIVAASYKRLDVLCLVGYEREKQLVKNCLRKAGLPANAVVYVMLPLTSMWIRDYGPLSVFDAQGDLHFVDSRYAAPDSNRRDDQVPSVLAQGLEVPLQKAPLILEGGDLITNGQGLVLASSRLVQKNREKYDYDRQEIAGILGEHLGCEKMIMLSPLAGEATGHVDMFVTFVDPQTVVVARYDPAVDEANARRLDQVASALGRLDHRGKPLNVERVTLPARPDDLWRTYTNVVFVNGRLLVPVYPDADPELNRQALATYRRLLPDWEIVGIDSSTLIRRNGALHCVTLKLPEYDESLEQDTGGPAPVIRTEAGRS